MTAIADNILKQFMAEVRDEIRNRINEYGMSASGNTQRNIVEEVQREGRGKVVGRLFAPEYIDTLIEGRGQTRSSGGTGIVRQRILQWISDKGIATDNPESLSWAISKTIHEKGTLLHSRGSNFKGVPRPTGLIERSVTPSRLNALMTLVSDELRSELVKQMTDD